MDETARMWMEITFNIAYLITVWGLVIVMFQRHRFLPEEEKSLRAYIIGAFALLALGDTGHVGFRVLAYARGDLLTANAIPTGQVGLVGLGALATAITVTFFYMLMVYIWKERFGKALGAFEWFLLAMGVVRLVIMLFPQNEWNNTVPPQPWSLYRNLPLVIQGLGVAFLILRDAARAQDRTFTWIGISILVSYAFYTPVILFVQVAPMVGMLMIPKTLAYVAIAIIAFQKLFRGEGKWMAQTV